MYNTFIYLYNHFKCSINFPLFSSDNGFLQIMEFPHDSGEVRSQAPSAGCFTSLNSNSSKLIPLWKPLKGEDGTVQTWFYPKALACITTQMNTAQIWRKLDPWTRS